MDKNSGISIPHANDSMLPVTGVILAGGNNTRMGTPKAFINICGKKIIDNLACVFSNIFNEVIIITNNPEDYSYLKLGTYKDIIPGKGPLGGIYTGLLKAKNHQCFVSACDMPFVKDSLVRFLAGISGYDVVTPAIEDMYEPMFSMYSKGCLKIIESQLKEKRLKIIDMYSEIKVRKVTEEEMRKFDASLNSLINVNTPEDVENVLKSSGIQLESILKSVKQG